MNLHNKKIKNPTGTRDAETGRYIRHTYFFTSFKRRTSLQNVGRRDYIGAYSAVKLCGKNEGRMQKIRGGAMMGSLAFVGVWTGRWVFHVALIGSVMF